MTDDIQNEMSVFPNQLSDEAAFALSEILHWMALTCDEKYFAQIRRHADTLYHTTAVNPEQPWERHK